jgi:hypothetical protein
MTTKTRAAHHTLDKITRITPNIRSSAVQQAQRDASADPPLRRAGHLPRLAWDKPLTANWYLHLYADPSYLSRVRRTIRARLASQATPAGMRALPGRPGGPVTTAQRGLGDAEERQ